MTEHNEARTAWFAKDSAEMIILVRRRNGVFERVLKIRASWPGDDTEGQSREIALNVSGGIIRMIARAAVPLRS